MFKGGAFSQAEIELLMSMLNKFTCHIFTLWLFEWPTINRWPVVHKTGVQPPCQDASYIPSVFSFLKLWCGLKQKFRWKMF